MNDPNIAADATLRDAVAALESVRCLIVAVVAPDRKLIGVISDGDVRRALLAGNRLDDPAALAMNTSPITATSDMSEQQLLHFLFASGVAAAPVVDRERRFVRIVQTTDFRYEHAATTGGAGYAAAVIMAGGEGRRLLPVTVDRPKPMIEVGGVPLLERQIRSIIRSGLRRIYISTNYLGHMIENHFGDGSALGAEIRYLREKSKLGTAGALSLLPSRPEGPLLVINGDILTRSRFGALLDYHNETDAFITVAAVSHRVEIPFGVLRVDGGRATALDEKPSESFLCNAGIYALRPEALDLVAADTRVDMTDVITAAIAQGRNVSVFPIHEYWTDIGSPVDLERAMAEFSEVSA